jgi:hypothetical protein
MSWSTNDFLAGLNGMYVGGNANHLGLCIKASNE